MFGYTYVTSSPAPFLCSAKNLERHTNKADHFTHFCSWCSHKKKADKKYVSLLVRKFPKIDNCIEIKTSKAFEALCISSTI